MFSENDNIQWDRFFSKFKKQPTYNEYVFCDISTTKCIILFNPYNYIIRWILVSFCTKGHHDERG